MRHIKTFESFYWADAQSQRTGYWTESKSYFVGYHEDDMTREIAGFLDCPIERIQFDPKYKDTSMFRGYSIEGEVDDEALEALKAYMEGEHGLMMTTTWYVGSKVNKIFLTEKSLKETFIDWLKTNYSGMEVVDSRDYPGNILYRYEPRDNILFYDKKNRKVYMRYDLIWEFFEDYFGLDNQEIKGITEEWLSEAYNLRGITTAAFNNPFASPAE